MFLSLLSLLVALVAVTLPFVRVEFTALGGTVVASGAREFPLIKLLIPLLALATLSLPFLVDGPWVRRLPEGLVPADLPSVVAIGLGAAAAVATATLIHRGSGVPYAVMGAVFGCQLARDGQVEWVLLGQMAGCWLVAPLLCCLLSALLSNWFQRYASRGGRHLAFVDRRFQICLCVAELLLVVSVVWNMGPVLTLFPLAVLGGGWAPALFTLFVVGMLSLVSMRFLLSRSTGLAESVLDFGPAWTLALVLSMALCLLLSPTPLSVGSLLMAGLVGISLAQQNALLSGEDILKSAASSLSAPVLGLLISYCLGMVLGVRADTVGMDGWNARLLPTLILLGVVAMALALYLYVRAGRNEARREQTLRFREEQVYSTQKALSALEVRVETHEKELLNKLEIKRKELVDFAVGVSDQKAFMENVYDQLSRARELPDGPSREQALDQVLSQLRDRMYFTREMNDFYARTEVLHRDFNMRLKESFPHLTESERRLANLLRQGFSSKYIASLMNITPKSVEISRYRLRTKLGLQRSDNLVQFIKSL